jgi:hypothetical protein
VNVCIIRVAVISVILDTRRDAGSESYAEKF